MTDIDKTERARQRGINARQLMETPLLVEAFAILDASLLAAWEGSPPDAEHERERIWLMRKLSKKLPGILETIMNDGKIADAELVEVERRKRFKMFG